MKYGFIGLGNMAGAIISGMADSGKFRNDYLYGYNRSEAKTLALKEKHGIIPCGSAAEVVEKAEVIVLAVKPQMMQGLLDEIGKLITKDKLVLTIAAGKTTDWYAERLPKGTPVVRTMPNMNAKVKASVTAICGGKHATEAHIKIADGIFSSVGKVYHIEEGMFPAFSALGGASGAFVLLYIDALAEAGVRAGFARPLPDSADEQDMLPGRHHRRGRLQAQGAGLRDRRPAGPSGDNRKGYVAIKRSFCRPFSGSRRRSRACARCTRLCRGARCGGRSRSFSPAEAACEAPSRS